MRQRQLRGTTLPELMMACFLLSVVLSVSGRLAWLASRAKTSSESQNRTFRTAAIAFERLQREALHARQIYMPNPSLPQYTPYQPVRTRPFVMRSRNALSATTEQVIGYHFDPDKRQLWRSQYRPGYDAAVPSSQILEEPARMVAEDVIAFEVYQVDPLLRSSAECWRLSLVASNKAARRAERLPMMTEVRLAR